MGERVGLLAGVATIAALFIALVGLLLHHRKTLAAKWVAGFGIFAVVTASVMAGMAWTDGVVVAQSPASSPSEPTGAPPPTNSATSSPTATPSLTRSPTPTPTDTPTPTPSRKRTIRLAEMCQPGQPVSGMERSAGCPWTDNPPVIGGAIFDADAAKGPLTGGYYEHGNWAVIIKIKEHTCTKVDAEFGRADDSNKGSGQHRSFVRIITGAGTIQKMTGEGTIGHISASLKGSPFEIQTSSDGGVKVFIKANLVCTTDNGHP